MGKQILCPYCFEHFDNSEALYQCENEARTPDGDYKCERKENKAFDDYWGTEGALIRNTWENKKSFFGGLKFDEKRCPACNYKSRRFVCPKCFNMLPPQMIEKGSEIISVIGSPRSGKTNYIVALIHQLRKYGYIFDLQATPTQTYRDGYPEESTQRLYNDKHKQLFSDKRVLEKTDDIPGKHDLPWIFLLRQNSTDKEIYLVFYDSAGEKFNSAIDNNARYVRESKGVIVLLDTLSIPHIQEVMAARTGEDFSKNAKFKEIGTALENFHSDTRQKYNKPTAFVLSKFDSILDNAEALDLPTDEFLDGDVKKDSSFLKTGKLDLGEIDSISGVIEDALAGPWNSDDEDDYNLIQFCRNWESDKNKKREPRPVAPLMPEPGKTYKDPSDPDNNYKLFGISSFGSMPESNELTSVKPYRVMDPLIWILHKLGQFKINVK